MVMRDFSSCVAGVCVGTGLFWPVSAWPIWIALGLILAAIDLWEIGHE